MKREDREPDQRLLRHVERLSQETGRYLERQLGQLGVTDLEAHVLWHLRKGGRALSDLQAAFGVHPSTLTGVIDRLEARGFSRREVNPSDRRSFVVALTPAGTRVASAVGDVVQGFDRSVRRQVSQSDLQGFLKVVEAIDRVVNAG